MATTTIDETKLVEVEKKMKSNERNSLWWDAYRTIKSDKVAVVSFFVILLYIVLGLLSSMGFIFKSFDVANDSLSYMAPTWEHWFGTDFLGRDVLARAVHGINTAFTVGATAGLISVLIGTSLGAIAGYFGGYVDEFIVWIYTTLDNIPYILLIAAMAFALGPGLSTICITFGVTSWTGLCRLVRGEVLKHREKEYVQAALSIGAGHTRRIVRHIIPNVTHLVIIQFSLGFVGFIKAEVILSYLGLGVEAGMPSWGTMINDARLELARGVWWNLLAATLFMFGLVLAFNLFNDSLRNALDPKGKR